MMILLYFYLSNILIAGLLLETEYSYTLVLLLLLSTRSEYFYLLLWVRLNQRYTSCTLHNVNKQPMYDATDNPDETVTNV